MSETDVQRILRQIQRAAGLDPDGPPRPLGPRQPRRDDTEALCVEHYRKATRDAMLCRAIGCVGR